MIRMVVAIDGNVNTGKTELFQNLKKKYPECFFAEEYTEVLQEDDLERQLTYLKQDKERTNITDKDIILDRSVLSLFGYVYWLYESKKNDIRREFYNNVVNSLVSNNLVLPNRIVYCYQDYDCILKSYEGNCKIKGTDKILVSKEYYEVQNDFYERLIEKLGKRVIQYNYVFDGCDINIFEEEKNIDTYLLLSAIQYALKLDSVDCITSINGTSSVGKSTLCRMFEKNNRKVIGEVRLVNKCNDKESVLNHQIDFYKQSVKRYLNKGNIVIDNGIFENISYTFFLAASQNYGLEFIDDYFKEIMKLYDEVYLNQIFYLYIEDEELIRRKNNDLSKIREHFESNISFRQSEKKFAELLSEKLDNNLFVLIDADKGQDEVYRECIILGNFHGIHIIDFLDVIYKNRCEIYQYYIGGKF